VQAVISLVTKSGTNKIHGDIFGEFRPDVLAPTTASTRTVK